MATLRDVIENLHTIYGRRNATYMPDRNHRAIFLGDAVRHLGKLIERKRGKALAHVRASIFARTCAFAEGFVDLSIMRSLSEKYPEKYCAYCKSKPCYRETNRLR
mgnify:CR=1 FL=1